MVDYIIRLNLKTLPEKFSTVLSHPMLMIYYDMKLIIKTWLVLFGLITISLAIISFVYINIPATCDGCPPSPPPLAVIDYLKASFDALFVSFVYSSIVVFFAFFLHKDDKKKGVAKYSWKTSLIIASLISLLSLPIIYFFSLVLNPFIIILG